MNRDEGAKQIKISIASFPIECTVSEIAFFPSFAALQSNIVDVYILIAISKTRIKLFV